MTASPQVRPSVVALRTTPSAAVVRVDRDIDPEVAAELRPVLERAVRARPRVVVDLTRVGVIEPTGLGMLVRALAAARQRGGTLVLAAPSRFVQTVLHTMRLHTAFPSYESLDEALLGQDPSRLA